ncbi:MAG: TetR/AcrR family transcriptional regulator [Verrucomicrobiae bacterium]|nr:TetR/AcrR family transcriptional regulator [Verrucomicrobiae bacterium]
MARVSDAKERLIEAVIELIWTGSYGSTSVDSICERAGVKKGSFYHFFESKTALALAGIEFAWEGHRAELDGIFSPVRPPLERLSLCLKNLVDEQESQMKKHGHVLGCPVHSLGAEISTLDEGLRKKLQEILAQYVCYYESAIRDANTQGLIDTPDAAATARVVFAYTEGVLGHARIWNDLRRLDELEAGLFAILGFAPKS